MKETLSRQREQRLQRPEMRKSKECPRCGVTGVKRMKQTGEEGQGPAGCREASGNEAIFSPCLMQITLFILSFDISVKPFLGTGQEARIERK